MRKLLIFIFLSLFSIHIFAQNENIKDKSDLQTKISYKTNSDAIFFENFDKNTLPKNWTDTIKSIQKSWQFQRLPDYPFSDIDASSTASAICPWYNDTIGQNEWIISPLIELADSFKTITLNFFAGYSKTWLKNADLQLSIGAEQDTLIDWKTIWKASTQIDTLSSNWQWREINKGISNYSGKKIKIGIHYLGNNGDLVAIDNLSILAYVKSKEANILSFKLPEQTQEPIINTDSLSVKTTVLYGTNLLQLVPQFSLSAGATSMPASHDTISVTENKAFQIKVQAANSTVIKRWNLFVKQADVLKNTDITSFSISGQTKTPNIDTINKIINVELLCTSDLDNLIPTFKISPGAKASIQSGDTIRIEEKVPYSIEIKAQDTTIVSKWQIIATVRDFHANITHFSLPQQTGAAIIDTSDHSVFIEVAFGTKIDNLVPNISISDCGHSEPASGDKLNFEQGIPKIFTVYAGDSTVTPLNWQVTVKIAKNSIFAYGFDVDTIKPPANWELDSTNAKTWTISRLEDIPFYSIDKRSKFSAICPWSADSAQNEWLISPVIHTQTLADQNVSDLTLEFYLGYNPFFMNENADVKLYIRTQNSDWTEFWKLSDNSDKTNAWNWHLLNKSLDTYIGDSLQLAWQYTGINGDLVALDDINLFSDPIEGVERISNTNFKLKIYPNPAQSSFTIECQQKLYLQIVDLNGKIIIKKALYPGTNSIRSDLQKGFYLLLISDEKGNRQTSKLMVNGELGR